MPACETQLLALKDMLGTFAESIWLNVNYSKSMLIPLNVPENTVSYLADALGCSVGTLPFTYLGLPMGTTRPSISDLAPLVHRMEISLSSASCYLNQGARIQLIQYVL